MRLTCNPFLSIFENFSVFLFYPIIFYKVRRINFKTFITNQWEKFPQTIPCGSTIFGLYFSVSQHEKLIPIFEQHEILELKKNYE